MCSTSSSTRAASGPCAPSASPVTSTARSWWLWQAAEPGEAEAAAHQQQHEPAAGERNRHLALLLLGGEACAEVRVDRLQVGGLRGLEEAPAGHRRDLLQRLR